MTVRPRISLCIPTYNRAACFRGALESALLEVATQPEGSVELVVCDNASTDETAELIAGIQAIYPALQVFRNAENLGFDRNYLRCVQEAKGEFVWVLGDDDVWLPGSLDRVLRELDAGADACLCLAEACDLDLNPLVVLPWYLDEDPPKVWLLETREDLIRYFNACARNAGVFAFISVSVFRRDRFLSHPERLEQSLDTGYPHLWAMMEYFRQPLRLHYIPETLVRNRMSDLHANSYANTDLYGRWMQDLRGWAQIADAVFGDDPEVHGAFSRILGRNHTESILAGLRRCSPTEADWLQATPYLARAGFSPIHIASVNFAFHGLQGDRHPMPTLDPASLCLVDLPFVTRGARRMVVMTLGGLQNLVEGNPILASLRARAASTRIRVLCSPECAELLDGFEVLPVEAKRYSGDLVYRESIARSLVDFAPELILNLDPERGIEADDLVIAALPAGAIAYTLPDRGQEADLVKALDSAYSCLVPRQAGPEALLAALGLPEAPEALWPSATVQREAVAVLEKQGWDPARTLAVIVDHPGIPEDPAFKASLAAAAAGDWRLIGIGGRGTYQVLETLLGPLEERAMNLAGVLSLGPMAALFQLCAGYLGGTPLSQAMARSCGCPPASLGHPSL